jgi:hypothetical protein
MSLLSLLFDRYANISPGPAYWLEEDECEEYCLRCIKKIAAGRLYSGYGCAAEQDGCLHCHKCGNLLDYVLTDHGALEELHHFKTVKFRPGKPLDRETAYHLARLIAAKEDDPDVIHIAARAIRCMKRIPSFSLQHQGGK